MTRKDFIRFVLYMALGTAITCGGLSVVEHPLPFGGVFLLAALIEMNGRYG